MPEYELRLDDELPEYELLFEEDEPLRTLLEELLLPVEGVLTLRPLELFLVDEPERTVLFERVAEDFLAPGSLLIADCLLLLVVRPFEERTEVALDLDDVRLGDTELRPLLERGDAEA